MKEIKIVLIITLTLFLTASVVYANGEHKSLKAVKEELINKYQVESIEKLDCKRLSEKELIELGDAVMEEMHPGEAHERMDEMMGGEGSQTLEETHLQMGESYLGCSQATSTTRQRGGWGNRGIMGSGMMGAGGWMPNQWSPGGWLGWLRGVVLVLTGGVLVAAIRYLWRKG